MKDEIKEMLDNLRIYAGREENGFICDIENYITNLQEENERLKEELVKIPRAKMEYDLELQDYKSRCEKAIEYINHAQNYGTMAQVMPHLKPYVNGDDLLNILGGKNEQ